MSKVTPGEHVEVLSTIDRMSRSQLDDVQEAAIARSKELKKAKTRKLKQLLSEEDVVRLVTNMKPRYLGGVEAPIKKLEGTNAYLQLPVDPSLRKMSGHICVVPLSAIRARVNKSSS